VAPGASMWATSPLNLQSPAATTQRSSKQQQRKARRVRERVAKGASPAAAERQVREEEASAQKLYRASRLYGIIGDIDADEGCSPRTWWINERQRRAVAQEKAAASKLRKEADAAARAAAAGLTAEQAGGMQSPYATPLRSSVSTKNPAPRTRQSRLRGGGRVLLPPSRARSPPVAAPNISHLIPAGPLLWDPVRGFEEERLVYPLAVPVSPVRAACRHAHAASCTNSSSRLWPSLLSNLAGTRGWTDACGIAAQQVPSSAFEDMDMADVAGDAEKMSAGGYSHLDDGISAKRYALLTE
jgi:hypothetical protein